MVEWSLQPAEHGWFAIVELRPVEIALFQDRARAEQFLALLQGPRALDGAGAEVAREPFQPPVPHPAAGPAEEATAGGGVADRDSGSPPSAGSMPRAAAPIRRGWTDEEDLIAMGDHGNGISAASIAQRLGRSPADVIRRIGILERETQRALNG